MRRTAAWGADVDEPRLPAVTAVLQTVEDRRAGAGGRLGPGRPDEGAHTGRRAPAHSCQNSARPGHLPKFCRCFQLRANQRKPETLPHPSSRVPRIPRAAFICSGPASTRTLGATSLRHQEVLPLPGCPRACKHRDSGQRERQIHGIHLFSLGGGCFLPQRSF